VQPSEITEVLNRPLSQELLIRGLVTTWRLQVSQPADVGGDDRERADRLLHA
jgi:hypothetical protein